jgi:tRNA (guanine10-N2)-methyltransferase
MGSDLDSVHTSTRERSGCLWQKYAEASFKFTIDSFQGTRSQQKKLSLINSFSFVGFQGNISLKNPDEEFTIFEEWQFGSVPRGIEKPERIYLGRLVGLGARDLMTRFDLKKRGYISTTSMDSELALVTANMVMAAPGKLIYDPFVGTGSFPIACAQFGALGFGSDIDGRSFRGDGGKKSLKGNFDQYKLGDMLGDVFAADLTNSPLRVASNSRLFDGIVCDPPYGVREGLLVLGCRDPEKYPWVIESGIQNWQ